MQEFYLLYWTLTWSGGKKNCRHYFYNLSLHSAWRSMWYIKKTNFIWLLSLCDNKLFVLHILGYVSVKLFFWQLRLPRKPIFQHQRARYCQDPLKAWCKGANMFPFHCEWGWNSLFQVLSMWASFSRNLICCITTSAAMLAAVAERIVHFC